MRLMEVTARDDRAATVSAVLSFASGSYCLARVLGTRLITGGSRLRVQGLAFKTSLRDLPSLLLYLGDGAS